MMTRPQRPSTLREPGGLAVAPASPRTSFPVRRANSKAKRTCSIRCLVPRGFVVNGSMSDDTLRRRIAAFFVTALEDLEAADALAKIGNRLAAYHVAQAVEKVTK